MCWLFSTFRIFVVLHATKKVLHWSVPHIVTASNSVNLSNCFICKMSHAHVPANLSQIFGKRSYMKRKVKKGILFNETICSKLLQSPKPWSKARVVFIRTSNPKKFVVLSLNIPSQHKHSLGKGFMEFLLKHKPHQRILSVSSVLYGLCNNDLNTPFNNFGL